MNIEKEIVVSDLKARLNKDIQNIPKNRLFLQFMIGKTITKTQKSQQINKQPEWKNSLSLTYFDEATIHVKLLQQQKTENIFLGSARIQIKTLKFPGAALQFSILSEQGQIVCTMTGKYTLKNLNPTPLLLVSNIRCNLVKKLSIIQNARPFIKFVSQDGWAQTQVKQQSNQILLSWNESLRVRIRQNSKLQFTMCDKLQNKTFFKYECSTNEFRISNGTKKLNIMDNNYIHLGSFEFDFETLNLINKQQSVKNLQKQKKNQWQLLSIYIDKIKIQFKKEVNNVYLCFIIGTCRIITPVINSLVGEQIIHIKSYINAELKQNKMDILLVQKDIINDQILAYASINDDKLNHQRKINFANPQSNQELASATILFNSRVVGCKTLSLDNISVEISQGEEMVGEIQPYLLVRAGAWICRSESGDKIRYLFKRSLEIKYVDQEYLELQIWDQDIGNDELLFNQKLYFSDLKYQKGQYSIVLNHKSKSQKKARINFKYELKNGSYSINSPTSKKKVQKIQIFGNKDVKNQKQQKQVGQSKVLEHHKSQHSFSNRDKLYSSREKQAINLPMLQIHHRYGDLIFEKQSASTLQKSILAYSMPKAPRFSQEPKYNGQPSYCMDTIFKSGSQKGVGFGFGRKKQFPDWLQKNMKQVPPPGAYLETNDRMKAKGPTFGLPHKVYEKVMIPKQKRSIPISGRKLEPLNPK